MREDEKLTLGAPLREDAAVPPDDLPEAPPESASAPPEDPPLGDSSGKRKRVLTGSTAAKVAAFLLTILMAVVTAACVVGAVYFIQMDLYVVSEDAFRERQFTDHLSFDAHQLLNDVLYAGPEVASARCQGTNIAWASVSLADSGEVLWSAGEPTEGHWSIQRKAREAGVDYQVELVLSDGMESEDVYSLMDRLISLAYALRYWVYAIGLAALLLTIVCFVFLMCASGHHAGEEKVRPGWGTWMPFDLLTLGTATLWCILFEICCDTVGSAGGVLAVCLSALTALVTLLGWCMSLALRLKLGAWWKNTAVYMALALAFRLAKWTLRQLGRLLSWLGRVVRSWCGWLLRPLRAVTRGISAGVGGVPLVWKTVLGMLALILVEFAAHNICWYDPSYLLFLWALERAVLFVAVLYIALTLRRLQQAGQALAAGDLSYQVDTRHMLWSLKAHGEDLNSIALGMNRAVEQRLKSERLKTELITNVSHDIKTPLTSIINYADLIGKEQCENEKVREYAVVLLRQSERLKKLIEDLVEASKASTGNLEVLLAPCEAGVLLTQTAGEYQQRLTAAGLELIVRQPEHPVIVMADGRRLWRVFDNLMNNICKYAQPGTRVYLTLEERGSEVLISFKNTSHSPLDVPAEELLERFTRGDAARTSEGNGLGLSIAQSLTELQKGTLELTVDGDLFKVVLRFPAVPPVSL